MTIDDQILSSIVRPYLVATCNAVPVSPQGFQGKEAFIGTCTKARLKEKLRAWEVIDKCSRNNNMSRLWGVRLVGVTFASLSGFAITESIRDRSKNVHSLLNVSCYLIPSTRIYSLFTNETRGRGNYNYYFIST